MTETQVVRSVRDDRGASCQKCQIWRGCKLSEVSEMTGVQGVRSVINERSASCQKCQRWQGCKLSEVSNMTGAKHLLTGLSLGSWKCILITTSNSPQPVSVTSYGGLVTTLNENQDMSS